MRALKLKAAVLAVISKAYICFSANAQQLPDTTFRFEISRPAYQLNSGPLVLIDEVHYNFHTRNGGFFAFSRLLQQDGYQVKSLTKNPDKTGALKNCRVLVIANALHQSNTISWNLPNPSAFTKAEINAIKNWVKDGGSLLLIADHMPFAGAAQQLAAAFGFTLLNGFARRGTDFWPPLVFSFANNGLQKSEVTTGTRSGEVVNQVATFTGSAFTIPASATPVLRFSEDHISLQPDTAWKFHKSTLTVKLNGYHQGAILPFGKGRVAVFGEAAMFTAQLAGSGIKVGFNSDFAPQNAQFVLNLIHWLDGAKTRASEGR